MELNKSALGKPTQYTAQYSPELLFPIPRSLSRDALNLNNQQLPFFGIDLWNHYEVSWLNLHGKPQVALAIIEVPALSPCIIESKSMKLYFNSFNNQRLASAEQLLIYLREDLSKAAGASVTVKLLAVDTDQFFITSPAGVCLDEIDVTIEDYQVNSQLLNLNSSLDLDNSPSLNGSAIVTETLYSNLLKSNCPVTEQPDWASVIVNYSGTKINHAGLLKYIISFRNHNEFHEQCVERIFCDIMRSCTPSSLTVMARFTRRGGIDINPIRSTNPHYPILNQRLIRQ